MTKQSVSKTAMYFLKFRVEEVDSLKHVAKI